MSTLSAFSDQLPDGSLREMNFYDSSFFKDPSKRLPTPSEVKALSEDAHTSPHPKPIIFKDSDLFVKFGPCVTTAEAQCLWMIKRVFGDDVPVPEVFGWRVDDEKNHVFIYMELIQGRTLLDRWNELTDLDQNSLRNDLIQIIKALRRLEQDPLQQYIGSISHQKAQDYVFQSYPEAGPFSTVKEFHDWFSSLPQQRLPPSKKFKDPYRDSLPDDEDIKFTHADLHRSNIMVSSSKPARILAIVDWEQAGWYPSYWEYCKARYTCWSEDEWRWEWIDKFLCPRLPELEVFVEYILSIGSV
ncbi:hypothetical protein N7468_007804 [Penicillium chermesinum]|uniref:Aminoglycoside phosphotransferase domain-containing protein n=1 Tax=Penicillium chermesinum TaxID=63820 RepID=A0A9W9THQ1_9EURO|nr:uncharacterized protein N7468_007804 [Penicillium chermesinum]KAJ5223262.1 hypothetical protein N7468_007804 [Penicillium chermesinum]KAJ6155901.1 hypothetical protein N7470_006467 [Penicillium chermesinum]